MWWDPPQHNAVGAAYERIVANRAIHLGAHILAIAVIGGVYELIHITPRFVYWRIGTGLAVALKISWVAWPFVISAIGTRKYVSTHRLGLFGYMLVMAGCVAGSVAALFGLPEVGGFELYELPVTIVQMMVLMIASERFLERYAN